MNNENFSPLACITGAAGGLGIGFAQCCAAKGYQLLLVDLPGKGIDRLALHLRKTYQVDVITLEADLRDENTMLLISRAIQANGGALHLLVNNAGVGNHKLFCETEDDAIDNIVALNIVALTHLTKTAIPLLRKAKDAQIINVSSMASFFALPFKNIYAASKAFVTSFSLSLRAELEPEGIRVSVLCPAGIISTPSHFFAASNSSWLTRNTGLYPAEVASYALRQSANGVDVIVPGRMSRIIWFLSKLMPAFLKKYLVRSTMRKVKNQINQLAQMQHIFSTAA